MITTAKASQKSLSQYIEMYQMIIDFSLEKLGVEVQLKFNKEDSDDMFDSINDKLIQVCERYLKENKLALDKFALATLCMKLVTQAASECDNPFKVVVKENRALTQEYLSKNRQKRETLERIKKENDELDKKIAKEMSRKKEFSQKEVEVREPIKETQPQNHSVKSAPSKQKYNGDAYSVSTTFTF